MDIRENILIDREKRMNLINKTFADSNKYIITIKCNICGDIKNFSEFEFVKRYFLNQIKNSFDVASYDYYESYDGNYYLVLINENDITSIKTKLVNLEEQKLGRFIDLDLYTGLEKSITRSDLNLPVRKCIICNEDAVLCMKGLKHTVEEVLARTRSVIKEDLASIVVDIVSTAMLDEVSAHPKFGLVTKSSTGKHTDMDYNTFLISIDAIKPYLIEYAMCGFDLDEKTFDNLREIGLRAESAMFEATNNINTHKGSIFILGFIIPSITDAMYNNKTFDQISKTIAYLAKDILLDFDNNRGNTVGERVFNTYKLTGVRGEVNEGLLKVFNCITKYENYQGDSNSLVIDILIYYLACLNDTVILHSEQIGFLDYVKTTGEEIINAGGYTTKAGKQLVEYYTEEFISYDISPGGSADMVIATLSLLEIKKLFY